MVARRSGHRVGWIMLLAVSALVLAQCGGPQVDTSACQEASAELMGAVGQRLNIDGALRHGYVTRSEVSGRLFVSAELHREDHLWSIPGDILTWVVVETEPTAFLSVDELARKRSLWPDANFTLQEHGAVESRGCVLKVAGTLDLDEDKLCPQTGLARKVCVEDTREELEDKLNDEYDKRKAGQE